jgi:pimeloyl-ACP methyl ester carboxylesterase
LNPYNLQEEQTVSLPDGRKLGYAEYGMSDGSPVLLFHGAPGARHVHADMAEIARQLGVRVIAVERPGYGLSDPQPGRSLLDWPRDIEILADALGVKQFAIIGFSMGTLYALACAYRLSGRVTKMALAGALAPLDVPGVTEGMAPMVSGLYTLAKSNPDELKNILASLAGSPAALVEAMAASAIEWDKKVIGARHAEFEIEYTQVLHSGIEGFSSDFVLASSGWGFPLDGIHAEIHLWSGTADQNTPPAMTNYLSSQLPNCRTFMLPNEGHCGLYVHWEEILTHLIRT